MEQTDGREAIGPAEAKRVFAITLFTDDVAESKRFYQGVFGMPIVNEDPGSVAFASSPPRWDPPARRRG